MRQLGCPAHLGPEKHLPCWPRWLQRPLQGLMCILSCTDPKVHCPTKGPARTFPGMSPFVSPHPCPLLFSLCCFLPITEHARASSALNFLSWWENPVAMLPILNTSLCLLLPETSLPSLLNATPLPHPQPVPGQPSIVPLGYTSGPGPSQLESWGSNLASLTPLSAPPLCSIC